MMGTLYGVDVHTINEHIKKIYSASQLEENSTIRNFRIVQTEGSRQVTRDTKHYNLQMIISVGFKVNNERAVQFRKWANGCLLYTSDAADELDGVVLGGRGRV